MTNIWPRIIPDTNRDGVGQHQLKSRHEGVASLARSVDGLILILTARAGPYLLRISEPQAIRNLVVAALGAGVVFMLHGSAGRYWLEIGKATVRVPFRACLPSFVLACAALPLVLMLLGTTALDAAQADAAWAAVTLPSMLIWRGILHQMLTRGRVVTRLSRRLIVLGDQDSIVRMTLRLTRAPMVSVAATFDEGDPAFSWNDLNRIMQEQLGIEGIVLALPYERRLEVRGILSRLRLMHADLYVDPVLVADDPLQPLVRFGDATLAVVQRRPLTAMQSFRKALFDRIVGLAILLPILPLILFLMLMVRIETPGPSLFRQPRVGLHGRRFEILKLRTMRADQTDLLADRQTGVGDPRVTRMGRWLRRLSLDELPQLINVVRGDMSLVGPRPHAPNTRASGKLLNDALVEYIIRHQVKPGITGWAQVNGARGQLETIEQLRRRVELDLEYMQRWSLMLDLRILLLTLSREVFSKHAY